MKKWWWKTVLAKGCSIQFPPIPHAKGGGWGSTGPHIFELCVRRVHGGVLSILCSSRGERHNGGRCHLSLITHTHDAFSSRMAAHHANTRKLKKKDRWRGGGSQLRGTRGGGTPRPMRCRLSPKTAGSPPPPQWGRRSSAGPPAGGGGGSYGRSSHRRCAGWRNGAPQLERRTRWW